MKIVNNNAYFYHNILLKFNKKRCNNNAIPKWCNTLRLKINIFFVQSWWFHAYCLILLEIWITQRVQTVLLLIDIINWRRFPVISAFYKPFYRPFMFMLFCIVIRNGTIVWKVVWIEYYLTLNLISRRYLYLG